MLVAGMNCTNSAIVLGTNVNGLGVIRSLGGLGVSCMAVYAETAHDHALHSKYLHARREISVDAEDSEILTALKSLAAGRHQERPALIPTTDRYSQFIFKNQEVLADNFLLNSASADLCDTFLDKWKTAKICEEHDILTPKTRCPKTVDELEAVSGELRYPVIIKPRYTFDPSFPGKNVVAMNASDLRTVYTENAIMGSAVVQEIVPSGDGDIIVVATYSNAKGRVLASYCGRRIRQYRPDFGAACFAISERHDEIETLSKSFLNTIGYRGLSMLEFARSRDDGRMYFLELNTRMPYSNQLFADAGIDLSRVAYFDLTQHGASSFSEKLRQKDGVVWLDFGKDFASFRIKYREKKICFLDWIVSIPRASSFAYWSVRDPLPFIFGCMSLLRDAYWRSIASRK